MRASEAGGGQSLPGLESPGMRLEWAFDKLCEVDALLGAIVATWARYTAANMKPGAERWICDKTEWGPILQADIRREWKTRVDADASAKDDPSLYPYTEGFVCRAWVNWRKQKEEYRVAVCEYFGVKYASRRQEGGLDGSQE